jgi:hypothetical protein
MFPVTTSPVHSSSNFIKSPKQRLGDLLFLLRFLSSLPNKVWETYCFLGGLIVFAPFHIIIFIFIIIILILSFREA